ncbi:MAG: N-methylhydantoinase B/oxoprolinase/acetone carboxylase [Thermodesulfobacterium sp.]|uniref:N-methylhydantoinase B/oxoprolinase/acetone carboxylase n=1 Tax=Candidatus Thermodesulfobacterium syntrophicum TaxID=3060442 RepID=A0AAE3P5M0_9BACT|nr:N-methylhydantoinase B/oxoprolinase/acetone carboxylase [Candidatus Thermodesulfobacterium syntrophicum]
MRAIELEIFNNLFSAIADEMGIVLRRSSFSPNIRERCDFSCAIFDEKGELVAQASHIPVHLGAMPETMKNILPLFKWNKGDVIITNDPFCGGTHLPDITLIKPVFYQNELIFFLIVRAHHADVGGKYAGSMAVTTHIEEEGILIRPTYLAKKGKIQESFLKDFINKLRNPYEREGDLKAQNASLLRGEKRLIEMCEKYGVSKLKEISEELKDYSQKAMEKLLEKAPSGEFSFVDYLDDDGFREKDIPIKVKIVFEKNKVIVDFSESAPQVKGCINATKAVTHSAVYYVFLSLLNTIGAYPVNEGCFRPIKIITKSGTVVSATYPSAVAAGNVETSQRIVDVLLGALSGAFRDLIPSASCGTMNNIAIGNENFAYYETIGGGMGARPGKDGLNGVHTHMTNTLNTPIEALEHEYPLRIERYALRKNSGGKGKYRGGDGLVREYLFLNSCSVTILSERRIHSPYGLFGGEPGKKGKNILIRGKEKIYLPGKVNLQVREGDKIIIKTPGGGGWGKEE